MRIALDPRAVLVAAVIAMTLAGCQTTVATPQASAPLPTTEATATVSAMAALSASGSPAAPEPASLDGVWEGALSDGRNEYPITLRFIDCVGDGPCGDNEYADPGKDTAIMCAAELTLDGSRGDALVAHERMTFNAWQCLATTLLLRPTADGTMRVEQFGDIDQPPFAAGTLRRTAPDARPSPLPVPAGIPGLGTPTGAIDIGGTTTQYTAAGYGSLWLPLDQGAVLRLDAATGAEQARIVIGDPAAVELHTDPHAVAVADDGAWVASAAAHALALIDPATNVVERQIKLGVEPYALAIQGRTAWVTSFANDALLKVDLDSGDTLATTPVAKPTGVAVGEGAVWVVEHRANSLVRLDPVSGGIVTRVVIATERPNDLCGACVENVVAAGGAVWTSDNYRRSVTRIDPRRNRVVAHIELPLRVWAVSAGDGRIWASQFDPDLPMNQWTTVSIDPATNEPTTYGLPSYSVSWAGDALWVIQYGPRHDTVVRVDTGS